MGYFGQKIRELREKQKLFLRQVAAQLEIDTALMSKIERGDRNASRHQIKEFAKILNASEEELLTLWLADKIQNTIAEEPEVAYKAMKIINKKLRK